MIYAENKPKDDCNTSKLSKLNYSEITLKAIDVFPEIMPVDLQTSLSPKSTGELLLSLKLKKDVPLMITTNINLNYRLINGQFGTVYDFGFINCSITRCI